jgi:glutaconate CoA-transferase subunit A
VSEILTLSEAIAEFVPDGTALAMEGFTHLIPHAAGHELIRQGRRELVLHRMTPDLIYDQLIGVGAAAKLVFSWGGNPGVGSLHRFRDAVENGWPRPLELVEHTHATMAAGYVAAASHLPFSVVRGAPGAQLPSEPTHARWIESPFDDGRVLAVRAHRIDVTVVHAQRSDRAGNVQLWGIVGIQKEAVMAAHRVIVTVEEIVDELTAVPGAIVLPRRLVTAVCLVPNGAYPSYAQAYTSRDNAFYRAWDRISRDRERFGAWVDRHVLGTANMAEHLTSVAAGGGA